MSAGASRAVGAGAGGGAPRVQGLPAAGRISLIVPVLNEREAIERLQDQLDRIGLAVHDAEAIFADGGSTDGTSEAVRAPYRLVRVDTSGRGPALNTGAAAATGSILLFLHCDSVLPAGALDEVRRVLSFAQAGSFGIRFDAASPVLALCQAMSNLRVRFRHIAYGDQGLFLSRELFWRLGGFPPVPLMEDYQLSLDLKEAGVRIVLARTRVVTSARRFPKGESAKLAVWLSMARLRRLYRRGTPPDKLARLYGEVR